MSKILSYNHKTTGEGWVTLHTQYNADEIEMIADPNAGLSDRPRTAIPSPFARMDLVKNAFSRLSQHADLRGARMDERLVSGALDVAQLFFHYGEYSDRLHIVEWKRDAALERLTAEREHRLLGETLAMYIEQDREAFNFDRMDRLFFVLDAGRVLGSTSPVTLCMASPDAASTESDIQIEQNVRLFASIRPLHEREANFVVCLYALFTAYPLLKRCMGEVNHYLTTAFALLPAATRQRILSEVGNPCAIDEQAALRARAFLDTAYARADGGLQIVGVPLYGERHEDILAAIGRSDFRIAPTRETGDSLPLVLQNHLNAPATDPYIYITGPWDDNTLITPADYAPQPGERILPGTSHQYPWLTADDFLQPVLIRLPYGIDRECFYDGSITTGGRAHTGGDYLLPLRPLFFRYFQPSDLWGTISGKPRFELTATRQGDTETVHATLRIPIQKQGAYITLERDYDAATGTDLRYNVQEQRGRHITVPLALGIFPFVRQSQPCQYSVCLADCAAGDLRDYHLSLRFYHDADGDSIADTDITLTERSSKPASGAATRYYRLQSAFGHIAVTLSDERHLPVAEAMVCPRWQPTVQGAGAFTFAVDFGTTNTHIEYICDDDAPQPLEIGRQGTGSLLATLYEGHPEEYDSLLHQEFLPTEIGGEYAFPQRTILSESERVDARHTEGVTPLGDVNIPFAYEKEPTGPGNRIVAGLKWSTDPNMAARLRAYLTTLALLMRSRVLLSGGNLALTRIVWFYPLSMRVGQVRRMGDMWRRIYTGVFGHEAAADSLMAMPESVAPYYYYRASTLFRGAASTVLGIDIGGATSDVVIFRPEEEQPALLTSFRYAADVLWGDGFSLLPRAKDNPMIQRYAAYYRRLFAADKSRYGRLDTILTDILRQGKSEEVNAFLFSLEHSSAVRDRGLFSYNLKLGEDYDLKIVFLYFYASLIHYVACLLKSRHIAPPRSLLFSGTGSKMLAIVGALPDVELLTRTILERVTGETYGDRPFSIITEERAPKEITCRGALMQVRDQAGRESLARLEQLMGDLDHPLCRHFSMTRVDTLTYADMDRAEVRDQLIARVREWNAEFLSLCHDIHATDRFLVSKTSLQRFAEQVGKDLDHHLLSGWQMVCRNQKNDPLDTIEDVPYFYPIIGSIRDNLIEG